jgi:hypothetical protein
VVRLHEVVVVVFQEVVEDALEASQVRPEAMPLNAISARTSTAGEVDLSLLVAATIKIISEIVINTGTGRRGKKVPPQIPRKAQQLRT